MEEHSFWKTVVGRIYDATEDKACYTYVRQQYIVAVRH